MAGVEVCLQVAIVNKSAARDFEVAVESLSGMCADNPHDVELRDVLVRLRRAMKSIVLVDPKRIKLPK